MDLEESGLHFSFGKNWAVKRYDKHRFYKWLSGSGLKGVDFIGIYEEELFLMEVKNFRRREAWHAEDPLQAIRADPEGFAREMAYKFEDTLLVIDTIWKYYNRKWLFRALLPLLFRLPPTTLDWPFWAKAYRLLQAPSRIQLVLWIEMEKYPAAFMEKVEKELAREAGEWAGKVQLARRSEHRLPQSVQVYSAGEPSE